MDHDTGHAVGLQMGQILLIATEVSEPEYIGEAEITVDVNE